MHCNDCGNYAVYLAYWLWTMNQCLHTKLVSSGFLFFVNILPLEHSTLENYFTIDFFKRDITDERCLSLPSSMFSSNLYTSIPFLQSISDLPLERHPRDLGWRSRLNATAQVGRGARRLLSRRNATRFLFLVFHSLDITKCYYPKLFLWVMIGMKWKICRFILK